MSSERPTVLHFIDTTGPGGAETVFLQLAAGLRDRGWPPRTVLTGPGWVLDAVRELELPVDVVETRGRFDTAYIRALHRLVREHRVGLIHAHLFSPAVYASLVGALARVPVVATFHGASDASCDGLGRRLRYRLIDRNARVVCVSEPLKALLQSLAPVRAERLDVIPNGVDIRAFATGDGRSVREEHGVGDQDILVGALGNVRAAKDFHTLLRAAAELQDDRRLHFAIVGERTEPLHGQLVELRDRLGLSDRLSFWGFRSDVPDVMAAFDILAISSSSEGFSLAAIQAMAAGTPVVATRSGGPEQIMTDGVDGLLVPTRSPVDLAAAIRRLVAEPALGTHLANAARTTARERFSLSAMLDGYHELYLELVDPAMAS